MSSIKIHLDDCTLDPETCPVVDHLFERDEFEAAISMLDPDAAQRRRVLGDFVTSCANGTCPAQDPELTRRIIREQRGSNEY